MTLTAAHFVAGHSLGEYSALCAAGALSARRYRAAVAHPRQGDAGGGAGRRGRHGGAARAGFRRRAEVAAEAAQGEVCQAANDNDPAQVVVSGHRAAVERAVEIAKARGAKRAVLLPVSAPFHCALMAPGGRGDGRGAGRGRDAGAGGAGGRQCAGQRRERSGRDPRRCWSIRSPARCAGAKACSWMAAHGVTEIWEIGAGKALSGMIRRIARDVATRAVGTPEDVVAAAGRI